MSIRFLKFLNDWNKGKDSFDLTTSGSTGLPKLITLKRKQLEYSALQTYKYLGFNSLTKIFNCIPTDKIGGFMNWVRAAQFKLDIQTVKASQNPMIHLSNNHNFTYVSLVPYQLYAILKDEESKEKLNRFSTVLIGGSALNITILKELGEMKPAFWHSYGMTETCSHFALKRLNFEEHFSLIGDIFIKNNKEGVSIINGSITNNIDIKINDIVDIISSRKIDVIGRRDNVINSGGIKINPEMIEEKIAKLNPKLHSNFAVSSKKDDLLGEILVLVLEGTKTDLNFDNLAKYEIPKEVIFDFKLPYLSNKKINRKAIYKTLKNR